MVCPITSKVKGYPFEVVIPAGLPIGGVVLSDHIRSLDWEARRAEFICRLPERAIFEVLQKISTLLSPSER